MTYEYVCTACCHEWEAEQPISEAPLKRCPQCKKSTARRQVSGGQGFILKGGGWYADGYGSGKAPPSEKKPAAKPSESATDAKPDATKKADPAPSATPKPAEKKSERAA